MGERSRFTDRDEPLRQNSEELGRLDRSDPAFKVEIEGVTQGAVQRPEVEEELAFGSGAAPSPGVELKLGGDEVDWVHGNPTGTDADLAAQIGDQPTSLGGDEVDWAHGNPIAEQLVEGQFEQVDEQPTSLVGDEIAWAHDPPAEQALESDGPDDAFLG